METSIRSLHKSFATAESWQANAAREMCRRVQEKLGPLRTRQEISFPHPGISADRVCCGKIFSEFSICDLRSAIPNVAGRFRGEAAGYAVGGSMDGCHRAEKWNYRFARLDVICLHFQCVSEGGDHVRKFASLIKAVLSFDPIA